MTLHKATTEKQTPARPLPGDRAKAEATARMIRVDHAGEFAAVRIYAGQRAVLGDSHKNAGILKHMHAQEEAHLARFDRMINERGVRPTLMAPLWNIASYALGAGTALLGEKAAMACTQAVETVIEDHYQEQRDALDGTDPELEDIIEEFQAEEVEHKRLAEEHGANDALGHPLLTGVIKAGCKAAIWISKRA
jgi:3-demethoxyubiquinol 3-hydroxylase